MKDWNRKWKINDAMSGLEDAEFTLERFRTETKVWYEMKLEKCKDFDTWSECIFEQFGYSHLDWAPQTQLKPYNPADPVIVKAYEDGLTVFMKRVSAATKRLQGVIEEYKPKLNGTNPVTEVVVTPTVVTLLIARNAVKKGRKNRDLLIVVFRSTLFKGGIGPAPDGTGHGDPT